MIKICNFSLVESKWKHIKVGDILFLERNDFIPVCFEECFHICLMVDVALVGYVAAVYQRASQFVLH